MPELLLPLLFFYLFYLYSTMKKSNTTVKKPVTASKTEQSATVMPEAIVKEADQLKKATAKPKSTGSKSAAIADTKVLKQSQTPKAEKKSPPQLNNPETKTPELAVPERIGLTAGSIWHYLSENGSTSVAKLVRELSEEEKVIQRSIGWLAQEGKITLETIDRAETISLTN